VSSSPSVGLLREISPDARNRIIRQALAIGVSLIPFGLAFGVACTKADLTWLQALAFSSLVFTGGSQFAAVGVLGDGGSPIAAITAGLLLAVRSLVYGIVMAPWLRGSFGFRALSSQLMIDESLAVSTAQPDEPGARRFGYFAGGISVFVFWNISTVIGALAFSNAGSFVTTWGIDATIPAAFAALLWPRLVKLDQRLVAMLGALIALVCIPLVPPGIPIVLASFGVIAGMVDSQRLGQRFGLAQRGDS
jgi:4-azaleucine resistance transporter AzlC